MMLSQNYQKIINNYHTVNKNYHSNIQNKSHDNTCKYCHKSFKHRSGLSRHIKYYCKKNDDEDLKEFVRLLNEKNEQLQKTMNHEMSKRDKQIEQLQKRLSKLSNKLQINNTTNNNGIINNNHNIILNNYKDTDLSHLTKQDYQNMIKQVNHCIPKMIEKIHFNPNKPENMNVYISNMKDKFIMMYKDGTWKLCNRNYEIDKMMDVKCAQISEWLDANNQYEALKQCFDRMEKNIENKEIKKDIQDEMKLVLYNNRGMLMETMCDEDSDYDEDEEYDSESEYQNSIENSVHMLSDKIN
tara:strand:+ start:303 stop:1196 length:894 start_codon:yes stop_codon:yes gene_type:complete